MASGIQLSGFLFLTGALACTADLGVEPICSRFDYDERLLAKTMRLENSMEDIMNRVAKIEAAQEEAKENKGKITSIFNLLDCFFFFFFFFFYENFVFIKLYNLYIVYQFKF